MYRNSTKTEYEFCSTVVNSQYKSATYTMYYAIIIIIIIISFIIILIIVVINILFIHKSWQQIRHGDEHDSRTQNSKAVQKNEFVFTVRMCVCLPFCQSGWLHWRLFCLIHLKSTSQHLHLLFWYKSHTIQLEAPLSSFHISVFHREASATSQACAFKMTCPELWTTGWTF